ncbi:MAG: type II secretion system F family protein [Actinomycetaceae bacterium]|nr:type II secretion system F family protein [Actinomycetaceae bacterium]
MTALVAGLWTLLIVAGVWYAASRRKRKRDAWRDWLGDEVKHSREPPEVSASLVIAEVIARLGAGASVESAWRESLENAEIPWDGPVIDHEGVPSALSDPRLRSSSSSIAAACRLTHQIGAPLAEILESVLDTIDEVDAADRARVVARAGPQMTARLLTVLPLVGVVASIALGIDVIGLWMQGGPVTVSAIFGVILWIVGHEWSRRMIRQATEDINASVDPVVMMDLLVASLRSGASIPHSLAALGKACREPQFERCATLLRVGAPFNALEGEIDDPVHLNLIRALRPAWTFGASPTPLLGLLGKRIRAARGTRAQEEAERLAVRLVIPLGLCLLPAFVAIGVVPIIATISLPGM